MKDTVQSSGRPAISIITATLNSAALFDRTAASLRAQTIQDFEWIVIDGKSTDGTVERIENAKDVVQQWCSEPDGGIAQAWNKGLARAKGDAVAIVNAGDTYDPTFLQEMSRYADGRRIVCCHARVLSSTGEVVGIARAEPRKLRRAMHVPHSWCLVPRQHYDQMGPYPELPLAMDFEWFHRYFNRYGSNGFRVVDQVLGDYYLGGKSDIKFAESFRTNEQILVRNGMNPLLARSYRIAYTLKHAWRLRLIG